MNQRTSLAPPGRIPLWSRREGDALHVADPIDAFYHDLDPDAARKAASYVVKQAPGSLSATTKHAGWKLFPVTYLLCTEDRALSVDRMQDRLKQVLADEKSRKEWDMLTMEGGHSPFLSKPDVCARIIRRAAGEDL